ncbi:MAG: Hsp20/alpha crystallin family protein [Haloarculaceae archaeon]
MDFPSRLFGTGSDDYELYEEDDEFVLSVEMPGFDPEDIDVAWDDGLLHIAAERTEETKNERRTYHRRFRFPKRIDDEAIEAEYTNGILEIRLPVLSGATVEGKEIEVHG